MHPLKLMVSAYVPCYNNAATVRWAVESVLAQTVVPVEVLVIDDGSTDGSCGQLAGLPVRIIRQDKNLGRGATRARAMREVAHEFVLCCDATNVLEPDFTTKALRWFDDPQIAAVFGVFRPGPARTAAERWRARHLFKVDVIRAPRRDALLATSGAIVRRSALEAAGGFNAALRHTEDGDLGRRLLAHGRAVICDSAIGFVSVSHNTVGEVLERYWRWYAGTTEAVTWRGYAQNFSYAMKSMVPADLHAGDWTAAAISLISPHYQFWKSWWRGRLRAPPVDA
jgi:glycosyltransferase involved in cell wall biosynthesis